MSATEILIQIIGGVCLLLWGVTMVRKGFTRAFGASLRRSIARSTNNRFKAFLTGVGVTTLLQSSTATSLIVTSFAARGLVPVSAAIAVMLGADVGTTLVAQLLSFKMTWLAPALLITGYVTTKKFQDSEYRHLGRAIIGLGLILLSLRLIIEASEPLRGSTALDAIIAPLVDETILALILGALLTWMAHSSLAIVLLFMSLASVGTIPVGLGLIFVLGANIGGTFTPIFMTLKDNPDGRRVPVGNFLIRSIGVVLMLPLVDVMQSFLEALDDDPARVLVNFHTGFNILLAIMFLPFIEVMSKISEKILPDREKQYDTNAPKYLDNSALDTPQAALSCAARETMRISDVVLKMLTDTILSFQSDNDNLIKSIRMKDDKVDTLYGAIKQYMAQMTKDELNSKESRRYMNILTFSTNLEYVGDIIDKNLLDLSEKRIKKQVSFSEEGFSEIVSLHDRVVENLKLAQNVFMSGDKNMARELVDIKATIRTEERAASENHFVRLEAGIQETIDTSSIHLDILRDLKRINSYITAVAYPILEDREDFITENTATVKEDPSVKRTLTPEEGGSLVDDSDETKHE